MSFFNNTFLYKSYTIFLTFEKRKHPCNNWNDNGSNSLDVNLDSNVVNTCYSSEVNKTLVETFDEHKFYNVLTVPCHNVCHRRTRDTSWRNNNHDKKRSNTFDDFSEFWNLFFFFDSFFFEDEDEFFSTNDFRRWTNVCLLVYFSRLEDSSSSRKNRKNKFSLFFVWLQTRT